MGGSRRGNQAIALGVNPVPTGPGGTTGVTPGITIIPNTSTDVNQEIVDGKRSLNDAARVAVVKSMVAVSDPQLVSLVRHLIVPDVRLWELQHFQLWCESTYWSHETGTEKTTIDRLQRLSGFRHEADIRNGRTSTRWNNTRNRGISDVFYTLVHVNGTSTYFVQVSVTNGRYPSTLKCVDGYWGKRNVVLLISLDEWSQGLVVL